MAAEIRYRSTRGGSSVSCLKAIVEGIAEDGGLYVPTDFPRLEEPLKDLAGISYVELARMIMTGFFPDFSSRDIADCVLAAYDDKFDHPHIAPLVKKGDYFFLELFHGPTLAFKDMALSVLPHLLKKASQILGNERKIVILTATSGDTGKAALEGFADVEGTEIVVFYPRKGVSKIQERQMVTQEGKNTHVVAIEGNFDDAQRGVKEIFSDRQFKKLLEERGYIFSSANSINIGRLIPQVAYYVYSYLKLLQWGEIDEGQEINFSVPTGNFGNILAAYYARKMGLPVGRLICASNINNVLYDFFKTGVYDSNRKLVPTSSPSMDILVSSNLERLIYDVSGQDSDKIKSLLDGLNTSGRYEINHDMRGRLGDFYGGFASEEDTARAIRLAFEKLGYLIDTHTAVGFDVYQKYLRDTGDSRRAVIVSTASPFKFPDKVIEAVGGDAGAGDQMELIGRLSEISGVPVPERIKKLARLPVRHDAVCSGEEMKDRIADMLELGRDSQ
ncbi:MAG: threonine synthase [Actinomycetota bacterium]